MANYLRRHSPAARIYPKRSQSLSSPPAHSLSFGNNHALPHPSSHKLSFNLLTLVSRFEKLDALNFPINDTSSQAPSSLSPFSSTLRGGNKARSPNRGPQDLGFRSECYDPDKLSTSLSGQQQTSAESDPLGTESFLRERNVWLRRETSKDGQQVQRPGQQNRMQLRAGAGTPSTTATGKVIAPYIKNAYDDKKRRRTIKDMIKLYDGAQSTGNNTRAQPSATSTMTPNSPTPIRVKLYSVKNRSYEGRAGHSRFMKPYSQTRDPSKVATSHRESEECQKVGSGCNASEFCTNRRSEPINPSTKAGADLKRLIPTSRARQIAYSDRKHLDIAKDTTDSKVVVAHRQHVVMSSRRGDFARSLTRRNFGDKIGKLYYARNLERQQGNEEVEFHQQEEDLLCLPRSEKGNCINGDLPSGSGLDIRNSLKDSKIEAMKRIFETGTLPKEPVLVASRCAKKYDPQTLPPATGAGRLAFKSTGNLRSSALPRNFDGVSPAGEAVQDNLVYLNASIGHASRKQGRVPMRKTMEEKISIFEKHPTTSESGLTKRRNFKSRKLKSSLKGLFEPPKRHGTEEGERVQRQNFARKMTQDIVGRVHYTAGAKIGKRNKIVGQWNKFPNSPLSSGGDGEASLKGLPGADKQPLMVVKEAECGLKQPKPVRVLDMGRMMLLCRERVGSLLDEDMSRGMRTRRL